MMCVVYRYAQLIVTVVLAVDMVLKSFAMGCVPFWRSKRMAFDGVMICLCLLLDVVFVGPLSTLGEATTFTIVLGIITISRLLRSTRILFVSSADTLVSCFFAPPVI